jgi:hypothetical protein
MVCNAHCVCCCCITKGLVFAITTCHNTNWKGSWFASCFNAYCTLNLKAYKQSSSSCQNLHCTSFNDNVNTKIRTIAHEFVLSHKSWVWFVGSQIISVIGEFFSILQLVFATIVNWSDQCKIHNTNLKTCKQMQRSWEAPLRRTTPLTKTFVGEGLHSRGKKKQRQRSGWGRKS